MLAVYSCKQPVLRFVIARKTDLSIHVPISIASKMMIIVLLKHPNHLTFFFTIPDNAT